MAAVAQKATGAAASVPIHVYLPAVKSCRCNKGHKRCCKT